MSYTEGISIIHLLVSILTGRVTKTGFLTSSARCVDHLYVAPEFNRIFTIPQSLTTKYILFFSFFFLAALGLSSCRERGLLYSCGAWASHWGDFSYCGAQALSTRASVVAAHGLSSCDSWALERGLSSCGAQA